MSDRRTSYLILFDIENVALDLERLALAVTLTGRAAQDDGIDRSEGGGIQVLGEVIGERVAHLMRLVLEGVEGCSSAEARHG